MFRQRVEMTVLGGQEAAFESALCEVRQRVFATPGFRRFDVAQGVGRPSTYVVDALFETADELADFAESGRFERCGAPVEPFLLGPPRVEHLVDRDTLALHGPGVVTDLAWLRG